MNKTSPEILELKRQMEENLKRKIKTPNDFISLSGAIWERTHETLSPTTLKRLWGYVDGADQTRSSTLDIVSRFLGHPHWDAFLEHISGDEGSHPVVAPHISARQLQVGERIFVSWKPNRRCVFCHEGEGHFTVESSENSKLKAGDRFRASLFILGEPLYLDDLVQGDQPPTAFVVGNRDGLCELKLL